MEIPHPKRLISIPFSRRMPPPPCWTRDEEAPVVLARMKFLVSAQPRVLVVLRGGLWGYGRPYPHSSSHRRARDWLPLTPEHENAHPSPFLLWHHRGWCFDS